MGAALAILFGLRTVGLILGIAIRRGGLRDKPWYRRYRNPSVWVLGRNL